MDGTTINRDILGLKNYLGLIGLTYGIYIYIYIYISVFIYSMTDTKFWARPISNAFQMEFNNNKLSTNPV